MNLAPPHKRSDSALLEGLAERRVALELSTLDIAFLALLRTRGSAAALSSFNEQQLLDAFETAAASVEPGAENLKIRITHTLRRLREQRLLTRVDAAGVLRAGEYALSRLASGVVDFFLEDHVLTSDTLAPLTQALGSTLLHVKELTAALFAGVTPAPELWPRIVGPLDVTCRELLVAIEKRQLGLDHQQEQFQKEIAQLLAADWFGSLEHCQGLLDTSAKALQELNEVLLRDSNHLHTLLSELAAPFADYCEQKTEDAVPEDSREGGHEQAQSALQLTATLAEHIDRVAAWGAARQKAWSDYYEYVHRYLRDVVRLDPSRALSQRLRQQLLDHGKRPFTLSVAAEVGMRVLRDPAPLEAPPPVRRERKPRDKEPATTTAEPDPMLVLEQSVTDLLRSGLSTLTELTERLTQDLEPNERFLVAGRIAEIVGRLPQSQLLRERPWVPVHNELSIEQRTVRPEFDGSHTSKDSFHE